MAELTNISLARGAPSLDIIAVDDLKAAAQSAFERDPAGTFAYGTSAGYPHLLEWIAAKHGVEPDRTMATNGSMQADAFLFQELWSPATSWWSRRPPMTGRCCRCGSSVPSCSPSRSSRTASTCRRSRWRSMEGARPTLAHIIPNFQNPAGCTLSLEKRHRLLELASEYGFAIFEDDPYVELRFEGESLPTMLSMDQADKVIYASSFSKTVCPGIRVGYLVGPADLIARIRKTATNTYISPNMVAQSIVADFCHSGAIERSIETVKAALRDRRDATADALQRHLPDARFVTPQGGYFLWVDLPEGSDVAKLEAASRERGVIFVKGTDFLIKGGESSLRIAYSAVPPDQIEEGIARVADAYRELAGAAA